MFVIGLDLGQAQDYTAVAVVERVAVAVAIPRPHTETQHHLRYLARIPLGTKYPTIVEQVKGLLSQPPLSRDDTPLVVDGTGVGKAVVDMFTAAGVRPYAVTITGGDTVNREDPWHLKVPKRDLVGQLVALYQSRRLKTAAGLELAPVLLNELVNFKVKVSIATGHDSYEAWRESVHDDLVLAVALACWFGEQSGEFAVSTTTWVPAPAAAPFDVASQLLTGYRQRRAEEQRQAARAQQGLPPEEPAPDDDSPEIAIGTAGAFGNPHDSSSIIDRLLGRSR
jgi:hypothetical protein